MKMQIILLYAGLYKVIDERTGVVNEGVTCNYYFNTDLSAEDNANGTKGTRPAKSSMPPEVFWQIKKAPALYDAEFIMSIGSDGKPVLKISSLEFISEIALTPAMSAASDKEKKAG